MWNACQWAPFIRLVFMLLRWKSALPYNNERHTPKKNSLFVVRRIRGYGDGELYLCTQRSLNRTHTPTTHHSCTHFAHMHSQHQHQPPLLRLLLTDGSGSVVGPPCFEERILRNGPAQSQSPANTFGTHTTDYGRFVDISQSIGGWGGGEGMGCEYRETVREKRGWRVRFFVWNAERALVAFLSADVVERLRAVR